MFLVSWRPNSRSFTPNECVKVRYPLSKAQVWPIICNNVETVRDIGCNMGVARIFRGEGCAVEDEFREITHNKGHYTIQGHGQPPNFQSLNGYNLGVHWSISLKFSRVSPRDSQYVVQGQRVKGQGNRQRRFTAKSVRICCLFNDEKGRGATWSAFMVAMQGGTSQNAIFSTIVGEAFIFYVWTF